MGHREPLQASPFLAAGALAVLLPAMTAADTGPIGRAFDAVDSLTDLVIADFDVDGIPDIVVIGNDPANWQSDGRVSVFLGAGNGILRPPLRLQAGRGPVSIATGDFDSDRRPDLAVANIDSGDLSVFLGRGDGTFTLSGRFPVNFFPHDLWVADFDHDGSQDIAVLPDYDGTVAVLPGRGKGLFGPVRSTVTGLRQGSLAMADFDRDGVVDLLLTSPYPAMRGALLSGVGDGTFRVREPMPLGAAEHPTAADFNGDGIVDLVTTSYEGTFVMAGAGDGTFHALGSNPAPCRPASDVAAPDLDGDGRADLVIACYDFDRVLTMLGNGDGTFGPRAETRAGSFPVAVGIADLDGDGDLDVAAAASYGPVSVHLTGGDGAFPAVPRIPTGWGSPMGLVSGDFDRDGRSDLAVAHLAVPDDRSAVSVLLGQGEANFSPATITRVGGYSWDIGAGDLDGDGIPDLAATVAYPGGIDLLYGAGDGTFGLRRTFVASHPVAGPVRIADLNDDDVPDLATATEIHLGDRRGSFGPAILLPHGRGDADEAALGDFNADGLPDLAISNAAIFSYEGGIIPGSITVLLGAGDGTFRRDAQYDVGLGATAVAVADFDGDGIEDLVGATYGTVTLLRGRGDGSFQLQPPARAAGGSDLTVADLDGDGDQDVALLGGANGVSILYGAGDGRFGLPVLLQGGGSAPTSIDHADFDRDGRPDLAISNFGTDDVSIFIGLPEPDADADGVPDAQDVCTDTDRDGEGDPGYAVSDCGVDNCPLVSNANQADTDRDGIGDVCDSCPKAASADQADRDNDQIGDACDNCRAVLNIDQADGDLDGVGNVCDACPAAKDPKQADSNGDGSGDACQPTVSLTLGKQGQGTVQAQVRLHDPQNEPLSGRVTLVADRLGPFAMGDALAAQDCSLGFLPYGVDGEGIGYSFNQYGTPLLFDLEFLLGCKGQPGTPDYYLALGPCSSPQSSFSPMLDLFGWVPPLDVCVRGWADGQAFTLSVAAFDDSGLRGTYRLPELTLVDLPWSGRPPREIPISGLEPGWPVQLAITAMDGNTVPASAEAGFVSSGETLLQFNTAAKNGPGGTSVVRTTRARAGITTVNEPASRR